MLERLYEAELDHLHELEEKYHAHLDRAVIDLTPAGRETAVRRALPGPARRGGGRYPRAVRSGAGDGAAHARPFPQAGREACRTGSKRSSAWSWPAEEEEHVAMLETEIEQL